MITERCAGELLIFFQASYSNYLALDNGDSRRPQNVLAFPEGRWSGLIFVLRLLHLREKLKQLCAWMERSQLQTAQKFKCRSGICEGPCYVNDVLAKRLHWELCGNCF